MPSYCLLNTSPRGRGFYFTVAEGVITMACWRGDVRRRPFWLQLLLALKVYDSESIAPGVKVEEVGQRVHVKAGGISFEEKITWTKRDGISETYGGYVGKREKVCAASPTR